VVLSTYADIERRLVRQSDGCRLWSDYCDRDGYGQVTYQRRVRKVHHVVWEHYNGLIPRGQQIRHTCDNPSCGEITHLLLGTNWQNRQDMMERGRYRYHTRRFTMRQAERIRIIHNRTGLSEYDLAEIYGVHYGTIRNILRRRTYR